MKRRLLHLVVALMAFAATTMAQSLSVAPIEATPGTETTITVNIAGAAEMTACSVTSSCPRASLSLVTLPLAMLPRDTH